MNGKGTYISPVARSVPFDNLTNGFVALNTQVAIEEATLIALFGSGADGDVSLSSGTVTLTRNMHYNNLTLSGTAVLDTNGFIVFVKNTLNISGTARIHHDGNVGGNASGNTPGAGAAATTGFMVGTGQAGGAGVTQNNDSADLSTQSGYGGNGGQGGGGGGNTAGMGQGGVVAYYPFHTVNMWHFASPSSFLAGGGGGAGGNGGTNSLLATAGAGGGGGSGGGVVMIFARTFGNTSTLGVTARGGNGGNGGNAASGNSGGGGGGGAGGGGKIYIVCVDLILGNISVAGGTGGNGGAQAGSGAAGQTGTAGSQGHYAVYSGRTGSWTTL